MVWTPALTWPIKLLSTALVNVLACTSFRLVFGLLIKLAEKSVSMPSDSWGQETFFRRFVRKAYDVL